MKLRYMMLLVGGLAGCGGNAQLPLSDGTGPNPKLPAPEKSLLPVLNIAPAQGWPAGGRPTPAAGLQVQAFADGLDHPRWLYVLPDGDVLVAETNAPANPPRGLIGRVEKQVMKKAGAGVPSANRITRLRDSDGDGVADQRSVFLKDLHSPFGMALVGSNFYVANTDAVLRYPYADGAIAGPGVKLADLPAGPINRHWTKSLVANAEGTKLYVGVGANSNVGEAGLDVEEGRALIWEIDVASGDKRIYASGLRNPVGMAWAPGSGALWTAVNERDELGSDLVPDYMTSVRDGGFYGWPWSYYGPHVDERVKPQQPEQVAKAIAPDYALGPHTASLGLASSQGTTLPAPYAEGMFVGQHGSWNRKPHSGYKVIFVPFSGGKPAGQPLDVLTGFLSADGKAQGRPVGVALDHGGALLVADDVGNTIWRVSAAKP
ncbi:sorbosone dehydrogenase family protein [Solimonas sp. K1W22B-7]|uniref:PQQ-dependent sugar dehydrogenase n=1 Tax=Solimonas sp. K1W22B-7 TaxID=2303331 RepID=UPI000E32EE16|nr:sorbosone dehydrogenase family protein [Solimonas sp. K1W22B-7]AXQ29120.1 sorbosone dehydrogenase family protein [Solimonas sp. K1W22B-7]